MMLDLQESYDKNTANECKDKGENNYNSVWGYACRDAGFMPDECESFKKNPSNLQHQLLQEVNSIKIEIMDVLNIIVHTDMDSEQAVNQ